MTRLHPVEAAVPQQELGRIGFQLDFGRLADEPETDEVESEEPEVVPEKVEKKAVAAKKVEKDSKPKAEKAEKVAKATSAAKEEAAAKKAEKVAKKETPKKKVSSSDGASLDDVLSSVTGGVNERIAAPTENKKPSKKKLDRGDVSKAMKGVTPKAKRCYSVEEFSGSVLVKYSVGPDGKVTKASATGAHKSSPTGACVVKAVKSATFPAFDGATMSFSFPFLLSP